jgi:signal transduction histidine kinase
MLIELIGAHREDLIARARAMFAKRQAPAPADVDFAGGAPLFLDQLVETLRRAPDAPACEVMGRSAVARGAALLGRGYSVAQVVHDYGDICQAVTELADELQTPITTGEFHTFNGCLDDGIAGAMTEYVRLRDQAAVAAEAERYGALAHELRNGVSIAKMGFQAIKAGRATVSGPAAAIVTRSLHGLTGLVDRALLEVRLESGSARLERIDLRQVIEDAGVAGAMAAEARGAWITVTPMARRADVDADAEILAGVLANLLQNALKFTRAGGHVRLGARVVGERVEIEIEDECGGLPHGKADELFHAFHQVGSNRTGLGLGLFISRKGVESCGGRLRVRDLPGIGCVFTVDLPLAEDRPTVS